MSIRSAFLTSLMVLVVFVCLSAQGIQPYPNAITNRLFYPKTPMAPPPVNTVFADPDLGAPMVRVTDQHTDPKGGDNYFHNPSEDVNQFSLDNKKFYVETGYTNTVLAFAFDPATMAISSLPGAGVGGGFLVPLGEAPIFSFLDPDLMYGRQAGKAPLTIATYRFSTGKTDILFDTTKCGTHPPLVAGRDGSTDLTMSSDDNRIEISAGGKSVGHRIFVIVYDQKVGCRWYNTQTGEIGGQWGPAGQAPTPDRFLYDHSKISGDGRHVRIIGRGIGFYIWDTTSLDVEPCYLHHGLHCDGYGAIGNDSYINEPGILDEMNLLRRPLSDLSNFTSLLKPFPLPHLWGMELTFAWNDGRVNTNMPVCGSAYSPTGNTQVKQPYDGEVFCMETDLVQSTIWRFAHNRGIWDPNFSWTEPHGNLSLDGRFFSFTSSWDGQVGTTKADGDPRTEVWIVKLD